MIYELSDIHRFKVTFLGFDSDDNSVQCKEFFDTETITAREWCEDWAYSISDKGGYVIEEVKYV